MSRLLPLIGLIPLVVLGFYLAHRRLAAVHARHAFLAEFTEDLGKYVQGNAKDETLYVDLTSRVGRMQREMAGYGVLAEYRAPFAGVAYRNYPILLNMLPEYRTDANDFALGRIAALHAGMMRDALVRYSGALDEEETEVRADLRNPIVWLREGVRAVLGFPIRMFAWLGILSDNRTARILQSAVVGHTAGVIALVGLVAGVVTILTGWEAASARLRDWIP